MKVLFRREEFAGRLLRLLLSQRDLTFCYAWLHRVAPRGSPVSRATCTMTTGEHSALGLMRFYGLACWPEGQSARIAGLPLGRPGSRL